MKILLVIVGMLFSAQAMSAEISTQGIFQGAAARANETRNLCGTDPYCYQRRQQQEELRQRQEQMLWNQRHLMQMMQEQKNMEQNRR